MDAGDEIVPMTVSIPARLRDEISVRAEEVGMVPGELAGLMLAFHVDFTRRKVDEVGRASEPVFGDN